MSSVTWRPYVDGTTHERSTAPRLADNVEEVRAGPAQLMDLSDATSEVLKAFSGGSSGQRFIAAIQPARTKYTHTCHTQLPPQAEEGNAGRWTGNRKSKEKWDVNGEGVQNKEVVKYLICDYFNVGLCVYVCLYVCVCAGPVPLPAV